MMTPAASPAPAPPSGPSWAECQSQYSESSTVAGSARPPLSPVLTSSDVAHGLPHIEPKPGEPMPGDPMLVLWSASDAQNPQNWSVCTKWWLTCLGSVLALCATFSSSAPSAASEAIVHRFNTSTVTANLVTSLFLCGYITGPLIWAPLSELVGRRPIFLLTQFCYTLVQLGDALHTNLATLFAFRFFSGFFVSAPLTNCGGLIADLWDPVGRVKAMTVFTAATFVGPAMGPVIGNFVVNSYLGFRWIFWVIMLFSTAGWLLAWFCLPETFTPVLLSQRAQKLRKVTGKSFYSAHDRLDFSFKGILNRTVFRPFLMLANEPILLMVTAYSAIVYGLLYATFEAFPIIWSQTRGLSSNEAGLIFIGVGIGAILGSVLNLYLMKSMKEMSCKWHGQPPCEIQLRGSMTGGPLMIIGIFWLGWTGAYPAIPWYVPALAPIFLGTAFTLLFISFQSYLIEVYLMYSASALAANSVSRATVAAAFPLFTAQMIHGLGIQWALSLIGGVSLLVTPIPFFFYRCGANFRKESHFAPALDLKMRNRVAEEEAKQDVTVMHPTSQSATLPQTHQVRSQV